MTRLSKVTDDELRAELERRRQAPPPPPPPMPRADVDWAPLATMLAEYTSYIASDEFHEDNDWRSYIYEKAIDCLYGPEFWTWLRSRSR